MDGATVFFYAILIGIFLFFLARWIMPSNSKAVAAAKEEEESENRKLVHFVSEQIRANPKVFVIGAHIEKVGIGSRLKSFPKVDVLRSGFLLEEASLSARTKAKEYQITNKSIQNHHIWGDYASLVLKSTVVNDNETKHIAYCFNTNGVYEQVVRQIF